MYMALVQIEYTKCWNPDCTSRRMTRLREGNGKDLPPDFKPPQPLPPAVKSVDVHPGPRRYSGNVCPEDGCKAGFDPAKALRWAEPGLILVGQPPTFEPVVRRKCVNCLCKNLFSETMNACPLCGAPHALVLHCSHCDRKHQATRLSVWAGIFFHETSFGDVNGHVVPGGDSELAYGCALDVRDRMDYASTDDGDGLDIGPSLDGDQSDFGDEEPED